MELRGGEKIEGQKEQDAQCETLGWLLDAFVGGDGVCVRGCR